MNIGEYKLIVPLLLFLYNIQMALQTALVTYFSRRHSNHRCSTIVGSLVGSGSRLMVIHRKDSTQKNGSFTRFGHGWWRHIQTPSSVCCVSV